VSSGTPSIGPVLRRPYRHLTESVFWLVKEWPDWTVRRDSVATCQQLGQCDDAVQGLIAHAEALSQTLRRLYDLEMDSERKRAA
jgi:hypothetical protein